MECPIAVNDVLFEEITKINHTLVPPGFQGDVRAMRAIQESLGRLIDWMGKESSTAQNLNGVITTADKLRNAPTHTLYLYKDSTAKNGAGEMIGLLKVGPKHLYLFDERDQVREVEPLCVLDFFIVRDRQRSGYGRVLFDYMLTDMEVSAHELAIDGPSTKMERFLAKNYEMDRLVRQNNNFAISPGFFSKYNADSNKAAASGSPGAAAGASGTTPTVAAAAVGRFAAPRPHSAIATVIHGGASYFGDASSGYMNPRRAMNSH